MASLFPGLQVVWTGHGYMSSEDEETAITELNASGAKMLFVAMGVPAQELWIHRNADSLNASVLLGVGALFDFYSGEIQRAPLFMRRLRLEWVFRLFAEPRRMFRRYVIGNPEFLIRVLYRHFSRAL